MSIYSLARPLCLTAPKIQGNTSNDSSQSSQNPVQQDSSKKGTGQTTVKNPGESLGDGFGWVWQETQRKSDKKQPPAQPAPSTNAPDQSNMPVAPWDTMGLNKVTTPQIPSNLWADWISKNEDWYFQNVGKLFPSYKELVDIELNGYIPFLAALEHGSEPISQSYHPQLTLKDDYYTPYPYTLPTNSDLGNAWQGWLKDNEEWYNAHINSDIPSYHDWRTILENAYIDLLEYIKAGNKINFSSSASSDGGSGGSIDHSDELRRILLGAPTNSKDEDMQNCGVDHTQYSGCVVNAVLGCGVKASSGTGCATAVSMCGTAVAVVGGCGAKVGYSGITIATSSACKIAIAACGADASAVNFCGARMGACGSNQGAVGMCGVAGSACGTKYSAGKLCGMDWSACGIKNTNPAKIPSASSACGVDVGDWCLINLAETAGLSFCFLNGPFKVSGPTTPVKPGAV